MRNPFSRAPRKMEEDRADTVVPEGARVLPVAIKREYDTIPMHVYHPTPHDAITILRNKKEAHRWFVAGWYIGIRKERGRVEGLVYRPVTSDPDRELVLAEIQKRDKEANVSFDLRDE
jgi:hypothetical protein